MNSVLRPGQAPEEPGTIGEERKFPSKPKKERSETTEVTQLITNVTKPTITVYRPTKEKVEKALSTYLEQIKFRNCGINEGYLKALGLR